MKIDIIGQGKVGTHLCKAFRGKADVKLVASRTLKGLRRDADIYLISVSDDAIREVAHELSGLIGPDAIMAHTSGTTPITAISGCLRKTGVFYPLQTFSKDVELNYSEIPFFIEGSDQQVTEELKHAASLVSEKVYEADSDKRRAVHIASVFACNFVNRLWALSDEYLSQHGLTFDMLLPLIKETSRKASLIRPAEAQTGPASRHDMVTIASHLEALNENPELLGLYKALTESIINSNS